MPEVVMRDPIISFLPRFSPQQLIHRQWRSWLAFRECYTRIPAAERADFVLVAYFDDLELASAVFGSPFGNTPWGGIGMRTRFHHATVNPATPAVKLRGLRRAAFERNQRIPSLKLLITIDETLAEYYRHTATGAPKVRFIPEPAGLSFTIPKDEARRRLGIPVEGTWILLYGHIDPRKGLAAVAEAIAALSAELNTRLLILGPQGAEAREYLATKGARLREAGRIFEFDRFASTTDESLGFSAADIVWLGYSTHHCPSSVLGKAAAAERPVIACQEGNIGWTTLRYGLGVIVNVHDPTATGEAVKGLVSGGPALWSGYQAACRQYALGRGEADFGQNVLSAIEESFVESRVNWTDR